MTRSNREVARTLFGRAIEQGGYFTTKQANEAGYSYSHLDYHRTAGNFERVEHGLYRIPTIPPGEHDELIRLTLWSRNQGDDPSGGGISRIRPRPPRAERASPECDPPHGTSDVSKTGPAGLRPPPGEARTRGGR